MNGLVKSVLEVALLFVATAGGGVVLVTVLLSAPEFYGRFTLELGSRLQPWHTGEDDPRIPLPASRGSATVEPAHLSYWRRQVWTDTGTATRSGAQVTWKRLVEDWLDGRAWRLMKGLDSGLRRFRNGLQRKGARFVGLAIGIGAVLGALAASAVGLLLLALLASLLGTVGALVVLTGLVVRGLDLVRLRARSIRMHCPYPGCWQAIALPHYRCGGCRELHRRLRPGPYGRLRRVCACGVKLPTSFLGGRQKLVAYCPHCDRELPMGLGSARLVHLPLVGSTSAGKTMLLMAVLAGLRAWQEEGALTVEFATRSDQDDYDQAERLLRTGNWVNATSARQPRAFMLRLTFGRRTRLLYLYDPMGESLMYADSMREQRYLAHADGVVLVIDVLADPHVRRQLSPVEEIEAVGARPAQEGPGATYERLAGEFAAMSGRRRRTPVALVVTKRDVLDGMDSIRVQAPGQAVDEWLVRIGVGNLVRDLGHSFGETRYWAVSASAAASAVPPGTEARRAAEPVLWLLARTGIPLRPLLTRSGRGATGVPGPRGRSRAGGARIGGAR